MALMIRRDCGFGPDFDNYIKIRKIFFHIDMRQEYTPVYMWNIDIAGYLDKISREIEVFQSIDCSDVALTETEKKRADGLKSRTIRKVLELNVGLIVKEFELEGVVDKSSLYNYFYNQLKTSHLHAFGSTNVFNDDSAMTAENIKQQIKDKMIKEYIKGA